MKMFKLALILFIFTLSSSFAQQIKTTTPAAAKDEGPLSSKTFTGLKLRGIGPAFTSGRIGDIAVHPHNRSIYFVAVASGGVWKTINSGTTWQPVFDQQGSYSIGCVTIDPNNPLVVWVGTGENNSQRSVSYGDGVYKSLDGGKTWKNVGLKNSEHIGKIVIDPRNSNVVYVAAQGPLWNDGGDRGLYKTTDGGQTWNRILHVSDKTGVTDLVYDPRNPDVLIAASYQRRRHVWTLIDGGPESGIYKSTDAGATWRQIKNGLPNEELGRIGLAISPANPNYVYAIIEAANDSSGFFRSVDIGENWEKRSRYVSGSPQYYQEIVCDPKEVGRVYSLDTWMMVTEDGGKTFRQVGEKYKHVDNHALWIDPNDTDYLLAGCDGGVYESFDRGATWHFKANLPVTQFYRVSVDNAFPFYNVYGGTQDNFSLGGPSRTITMHGITNADWFVTLGGDGFKTQIDPQDPNIVYSQLQYGVLVRFDKKSGERILIQPQPGKGEEALRWNWDSALLISPHSHTRLYFAANRIFRSDDRGNSWRPISPDLTRRLDRNQLKVMGKIQRIDAVAKNASTSFFGNIVSLSESPLQEGLIYAGTDDGLIQVTGDGGATWQKFDKFPGVPEMTYVSRLEASQHEVNTVYAAFDNHKNGDFKPYVLKSKDRGKTWESIAGNLPERGSVYALAEDHVKPDLLFAGTEFGVFFTIDGGKKWIQLKGGMPIIAVRDLAIQKRENDLALATFGRGFYILDDYSPLRHITPTLLEGEANLFPVKKAWMYMESAPLGLRGKAFQGDSYFTAPNPPFGAVFTYYLKEELKTRRQKRQENEKKIEEQGGVPPYPKWEELRAEEREEKPAVILTIKDEEGNVVRRLNGGTSAGIQRVAWDLRFPPANPTSLEPPPDNPFIDPPVGPMVVPGNYTVTLSKRVDGVETQLGAPQPFETVPLGIASLPAEDRKGLLAFQRKTARLQRAVLGAGQVVSETQRRFDFIKRALQNTPEADPALVAELRTLENRLKDLQTKLSGDRLIQRYNEPSPPAIIDRVQDIVGGHWTSTSVVTQTFQDGYQIAAEEFSTVLESLRVLIEVDLAKFEAKLEQIGAPWTPGRVPRWSRE
ncbi:MAG: glycosyl hydrolase [candidate division KSB1 bacterium]|nr:glycosyl hydrolase [candidate division KSB1 bacterium]MDZ7366983.1 glycosyl hydrolase [candidate division KSB1 bacterium]MDZ7406812.1 glycosyl hydrolase [candidate division KSB1 bacterium]